MSTEKIQRVNIGKNIKYIRKLKDYTQEELAEALGITQSAVSQFERSAEGLHEKTIKKISDELKVDPLFLYFVEVSDENHPDHELAVNIITNYPPDEQYKRFNDELKRVYEQRNSVTPDELSSLCLSVFNSLNTKGKEEAIKRIQELAQLDQYKKED